MSDDLSRDLEIIASEIPAAPRGLAELRAMLASLPSPSPLYTPGVMPNELPETTETSQQLASGTAGMGGTGATSPVAPPAGTVPGGTVMPRTLPGTALKGKTLDKAVFVDSMRPPTLWPEDPKPPLPDPEFPPGSLIFWTTDGKLYRNDGDVWTAAVEVTDLVGQITADQIMANAITAGKIAAGAVTADALASQIILGDVLITTGTSGARVEMDDDGIRNIDSSGKTVVNIPTAANVPVSVVGEIEATNLETFGTTVLGGTTKIPGSAVLQAESTVTDPTLAPTYSQWIGSLTLTSTPTYRGHGVCYDAAGGAAGTTATYWLGADPTTGNLLDMAYEYNASTGALVRTIQKTGTTVTKTGTAGSTSHVSDTAEARDDVDTSNIATPIVMPSDRGNMTITKVSVYIAGFGGTETCRVGIWNDVSGTGNLLRESATFNVGSRTFTTGNAIQYNKDLSSGYTVSPGATIYAGWRRTANGPGFWWDRDDGSGKTTYAGAGYTADGTGWGVWNSASKPNVYVTYTYEENSSAEGVTGKIVGVARAGSYVFCLDANGVLFQYNQSTLAYVGKVDLSAYITGPKTHAGLFYDGTNLVICTATGVTGTDQVKFVKASATTGAYVSAHSTTGNAINGSTALVRGGYSGTYYWISINGSGRPYDKSTYAYVANYEFGNYWEMDSGLTYDGSKLRGWSSASNPTKIYQYSDWTWTTESAVYWICYTWYDITGTTHETKVSPRASVTMGRRRNLTVSNPAIPTGGAEPADRVRIYMARGASDPGGANYDLQVTDANTSRTISSYNSGGAANPTSNNFPGGTPGELKSATAGWSLKGDGTATIPGGDWNSVTYSNSWITYTGWNNAAKYRKAADGTVYLTGMISSGTTQVAAFTLPAGYRPDRQLLFTVQSSAGLARVDVRSSGAVEPHVSAPTWLSLDGICFKAEA